MIMVAPELAAAFVERCRVHSPKLLNEAAEGDRGGNMGPDCSRLGQSLREIDDAFLRSVSGIVTAGLGHVQLLTVRTLEHYDLIEKCFRERG